MTSPSVITLILNTFFCLLPFSAVLLPVILTRFDVLINVSISVSTVTWIIITVPLRPCIPTRVFNSTYQSAFEFLALWLGITVPLFRHFTPNDATWISVVILLFLKVIYDFIMKVTGSEELVAAKTVYARVWTPIAMIFRAVANIFGAVAMAFSAIDTMTMALGDLFEEEAESKFDPPPPYKVSISNGGI